MAKPNRRTIVDRLLAGYGVTFAQELKIDIDRGGPGALWQLLCLSMLLSARIRGSIAIDAARQLFRAGWRTPQRLAESTWQQRVEALDAAGYARYDERTATMLGENAEYALGEYRGDLRRLREAAGRDPDEERRLIKRFKGIGAVGADIFFREVQSNWDEIAPFADRRALAAAERLGLGRDARALSKLVAAPDFARLIAALVRVEQEDGYDAILRPEGKPAESRGARHRGSDLSSRSRAELYERAKQASIPGRSRMSKQELERALS